MTERIPTYAEFWPFYLREHASPSTRWMHFLGTSLGVLTGGTAVVKGNASLILPALLAGYGFAWVSHFFVEKNRPASFKYPLWSLVSDFRMAGLMLMGRLDKHLARAGVRDEDDQSGGHLQPIPVRVPVRSQHRRSGRHD